MSDPCHCGSRGRFGYVRLGRLVWRCEAHRLAIWWADARRDGSDRHLVFNAGRIVPVQQDDRKGDSDMDMSKYNSGGLIKSDDIRDGPLQERIGCIYEDEKYGRPVLEFENGDKFRLNITNNRILCKAWGRNSDDWIGLDLELSIGTYKDWNTDPVEEKETVIVKAISVRDPTRGNGSPETTQATSRPRPPTHDEMNDEIPF